MKCKASVVRGHLPLPVPTPTQTLRRQPGAGSQTLDRHQAVTLVQTRGAEGNFLREELEF